MNLQLKISYSKPLFLCNALELKALSGQILIVLDILVLAKEECERDKKYIATSIFNKRGADIFKYFTAMKCSIKQPTYRKTYCLRHKSTKSIEP